MKLFFTLIFTIALCYAAASQSINDTALKNQTQTYTYASITIEGKAFSKKLSVEVDFGDTPEQIDSGKVYSEILSNKKSIGAVLNYMADKQYDLVTSTYYNNYYQGTVTTSGIYFIMKKKITTP